MFLWFNCMSFNQFLMKVMGLYFGAIEGNVAVVRSLMPIRRTTKEKDRWRSTRSTWRRLARRRRR